VVMRAAPDLAEWLRRYDLGEYAQTFAENNIDYSALPDLTEDDLKKLGVLLAHRKKTAQSHRRSEGTESSARHDRRFARRYGSNLSCATSRR